MEGDLKYPVYTRVAFKNKRPPRVVIGKIPGPLEVTPMPLSNGMFRCPLSLVSCTHESILTPLDLCESMNRL